MQKETLQDAIENGINKISLVKANVKHTETQTCPVSNACRKRDRKLIQKFDNKIPFRLTFIWNNTFGKSQETSSQEE